MVHKVKDICHKHIHTYVMHCKGNVQTSVQNYPMYGYTRSNLIIKHILNKLPSSLKFKVSFKDITNEQATLFIISTCVVIFTYILTQKKVE